MKQPLCLITPPSPFLLDERVFVSLGILRVAAVLEEAGHAVEHLDLSGVEGAAEAAADHARSSSAEVFGLTATTPQMPAAVRIAEAIRRERSDARLILGGPHITLVNAARKREERLQIWNGRAAKAFEHLITLFDTLVAGDGEHAIHVAILPSAPKLVDADDAKGPLFLTNETLNALPWPARHLVDLDSYAYTIEGERATSLIAQLGCPFHCGFCGGRESPMLRRIRMRSTENVVAEMVDLYERHGVKGFMLYDDELNVNKGMVALMGAIFAAQLKLGVEWRLRGFIKSQLFTDEQALAMQRAGFRWILVGFESGSPRILENIRKEATREENSRCMDIARRHGLKVKALMSIGHPGESEETIAETRDWLMQEHPDDFDLTLITTYPGTPYYDEAEENSEEPGVWTYTARNGDRLHSQDVDFTTEQAYYKGAPGDYRAFVHTDFLSAEQLVGLRDAAESDVRLTLGIPFNHYGAAQRYEHSMGQGLPDRILRASSGALVRA